MNQVFQRVAGVRPGRSIFDLSYESKLTCDMGQLIPVQCDEVVPGDTWNIGHEILIRFQPLIAPMMHKVTATAHSFFVPYRLLWDLWEEFITGGVDGESAAVLPRWNPTTTAPGSLWDYLGFPTMGAGEVPAGALPIDFPKRAYNLICNEYYFDETLQEPLDIEVDEGVQNRCWTKDYFTSALPFQQRGTAPALPISGTSAAIWSSGNFAASGIGPVNVQTSSGTGKFITADYVTLNALLNNNVVNLGSAITFDVSDLRLAFQIQKWMERNARAGVRYTEFLGAHFGVHPRDERLQRPEYIGGTKVPVIVSEVLQTSSTDATSPQGNMAGHGISVDRQFAAKYTAQEFGLIMTILSVMPDPAYQEGIDRQWLRRTKYDFYFPEFANLSEQAIEQAELVVSTDSVQNTKIFGYQGRYDELRTKKDQVHGLLRTDLKFWHMGRILGPSLAVELNDYFVVCQPTKRIFAVPTQPGLIVQFGNIIKAIRPMPIQSNPGLIDHV